MTILPIMDLPGKNIAVAGDMILLAHINNAKAKAASNSFLIKTRFLLIQNCFRLISIYLPVVLFDWTNDRESQSFREVQRSTTRIETYIDTR